MKWPNLSALSAVAHEQMNHIPVAASSPHVSRTPRAIGPESTQHAPATAGATFVRAFDFPSLSHASAAPRTVFHVWHQFLARALVVVATSHVASVRIGAAAVYLKSSTIAPRAILPIGLETSIAPRADDREMCFARMFGSLLSTPWTCLHCLRYWSVTGRTGAVSLQCCTELSLKLTLSEGLPISRCGMLLRDSRCASVFGTAR